MRKSFYFFVSLVVLAGSLASCDWLQGSSDHSPDISVSHFYVNPVLDGDSVISAKDTLGLYYHSLDQSYRMDSLAFGDTVFFVSTYYTYEQPLISVTADWEKDRMDYVMEINDSIAQHLSENSDIASCKLYFNPGFNRVTFPNRFTAKEYGILPLKLTVTSTSQFSPSSVYITIPIKRPE